MFKKEWGCLGVLYPDVAKRYIVFLAVSLEIVDWLVATMPPPASS